MTSMANNATSKHIVCMVMIVDSTTIKNTPFLPVFLEKVQMIKIQTKGPLEDSKRRQPTANIAALPTMSPSCFYP
ncbi:unnamed protein product [Pleuronectes platessa]|uniref:Uncharacterized protein n=1 Tax=Pleuronectes platessa TaxID=8262 RepID=A0A9N7YAE5_PLEPL|nr:unnamed protein product [Pleuronectes platessa]